MTTRAPMGVVALLATAVLSATLAVGTSSGQAETAFVHKPANTCSSRFPNHLAGTRTADQLVTVIAKQFATTEASVERWTRERDGCFRRVGAVLPAIIGRSGLSSHHVEGDGTTPVGVFAFGKVMYGIDANPGVQYPYHRLVCGDWWDEDPSSALYNQFVHVACGTYPSFGRESEALWTTAPFYDWMAVIAYNTSPIVPGRGSGIFLHVATGAPTAGCVSLPSGDLLSVLRWLKPARRPLIAIGTAAELDA